jgi:hypothetical protein
MYISRNMAFGRFYLWNSLWHNLCHELHIIKLKISYCYHELCIFLGKKRIITTPILLIDPVLQYVQKRTSQFLKTFEKINSNENKYNTNIDTIIYNKADFFDTLLDPNNFLEKIWKKRILIENTPRGNIYMYYDIFKQGFAYYSDQAGIPYRILNAVAMRYVVVFHCRDFFLDDNVLPNGQKSPLLNVFIEDNEEEKQKKRDKMDAMKINLKNAPFAKFKTYQNTPKNIEHDMFASVKTRIGFWRLLSTFLTSYFPFLRRIGSPEKISKNIDLPIPDIENNAVTLYKKEKVVNKFINLGHTNNFHPLLSTKPTVIKSVTKYDSMFSQVNQISYKDFISRKNDS